jgi:hypothetical protein
MPPKGIITIYMRELGIKLSKTTQKINSRHCGIGEAKHYRK